VKPAGPKCIFHTAFIREQIDPRVKDLWPTEKVPFGDLRRTWRLRHCATVNPYWDSEMCPYLASNCALAFLAAVQSATSVGVRNPMGLFRTLARSDGLRRLEDKPLARDQARGEEGPSLTRVAPGDPEPRPGSNGDGRDHPEDHLRGARRRPVSAGDVLRSLNLGPHSGQLRPDGPAGSE
jgi:hypothetical protein